MEGVNKFVGKFTEFHFTPAWKGKRDLEYFDGEEDVRYLDLFVYKHVNAALQVVEERVPERFVADDEGLWVYHGDLSEVINAKKPSGFLGKPLEMVRRDDTILTTLMMKNISGYIWTFGIIRRTGG